jgi:hypothetical protein
MMLYRVLLKLRTARFAALAPNRHRGQFGVFLQ